MVSPWTVQGVRRIYLANSREVFSNEGIPNVFQNQWSAMLLQDPTYYVTSSTSYRGRWIGLATKVNQNNGAQGPLSPSHPFFNSFSLLLAVLAGLLLRFSTTAMRFTTHVFFQLQWADDDIWMVLSALDWSTGELATYTPTPLALSGSLHGVWVCSIFRCCFCWSICFSATTKRHH